jgi:energy-coupling factor transport system ATP-binding protein
MSGGRILADGPAPEILSQVDLLAQADVEPPQIAQLSRALGLPSTPMSVEEFVELFAAQRGHEV